MRVFISQPMRGLTNEEIKNIRDKVIKNKTIKGDIIIDSFFENAPVDAKPLWFLGKSLQLLSTADKVIFIGGWEKFRGCVIEHECAKQYGIQIEYSM